ncbi:MAG: ERF family protein [Monoglobales bacterium]
MRRDVLTLQEKMVELRAAIPALVKRAYSEEVSYDFVKIDDIFRHLTRAMNEQKVNMDIEFEHATRKDDAGNPMFIQYQASCQMWLYEADLGLRWINAEDPEDFVQTTIHAIGVHEMPEKAKGSGWTYALKYYLLNKFCIDQGGEDPDKKQTEYRQEDDRNSEESVGQLVESPKREVPVSPHILPENGQEVTLPDGVEPDEQMRIPGTENQQKAEVQAESKAAAKPASKGTVKATQKTVPDEVVKTENSSESGMTVEEASNVICNIGIYRNNNKTLGEIAKEGDIDSLQWYAKNYKGPNQQLREGAAVLLKAASVA